MNQNHLISVIVSTYNRSEFLSKTIDSILNQTYRNFELIIVDDGSTDNTENVINNYNDYRIIYIKTDNWGGPARPRNIGIKQSKGNYIAFCDDDDIWKNNKLEKQLRLFKMNKDLGICFTSYSIINNKDKAVGEQKIRKKNSNPTFTNFFLSAGYICNSSVMIDANLLAQIGYQNESLKIIAIEDSEYWARILSMYKGCFIKEKLVEYRIHDDSIQRKTNHNFLTEQKLFYQAISEKVRIPFFIRLIKIIKIYLQYIFSFIRF